MSFTKFIPLIVALSGCAAAPLVVTGVGITSVAVNETTGRTIADHAVSAANNGQDCRLGRSLKSQEICQPDGVTQLKVSGTGVTPSTIQEIESKYR